MTYLDCELIRLVDIETDHLVYVGHITGGGVIRESPPAVVYGGNGSSPHRAARCDARRRGRVTRSSVFTTATGPRLRRSPHRTDPR